eukprot:1729161-Rhodomonas_salina.1
MCQSRNTCRTATPPSRSNKTSVSTDSPLRKCTAKRPLHICSSHNEHCVAKGRKCMQGGGVDH